MREGLNRFMFMYKTKTWFDVVQAVCKNRNSSVIFSVKVTPDELFQLKNLKKNKDKIIKQFYNIMVTDRMNKLKNTKGYQHNALSKNDKVRLSLKKEKKIFCIKRNCKANMIFKILYSYESSLFYKMKTEI